MNIKNKHLSISDFFVTGSLILFLIAWIVGIRQDVNYSYNILDVEMNFLGVLKLMVFSNRFVQWALFLLAVIGFFIKKPFGWILISSFYYFVLFDWIFITLPVNNSGLIVYSIVLIPIVLILITSLSSFRKKYLSIKNSLLTMILISIIVALSCTLLKGYYHFHFEKSIFEIIPLIRVN